MYKSLQTIQAEQKSWSAYNFPQNVGIDMLYIPALGVAEEAGELCHAVLKRMQNIRATTVEHDAAMKDSIGDICIYLMDLCNKQGWDFEAVINETWATVIQRDWRANPMNGVNK